MRRANLFAVVACLLLSLSCRHTETDPSAGPQEGPGLASGRYVLRSVAGQELPAFLIDNEYASIVALADTVWIDADGTGWQVIAERSTDKGSPSGPVVTRNRQPFSYETAGNRITVSFECNDVIIRMCMAPPHWTGVLTEGSLVLEYAVNYRTPLHYQWVGP